MVACLAVACLPVPAAAASLPTVASGARPGPPLLYAPQPRVPELSVRPPFSAAPLLVSATDAYRDGEYLYQDYLYDDHGGDVKPGNSSPPGSGGSSRTSGDVLYPTGARYGNNAADLVELRIRPTRDAVVYRVTLNTVLDDDAAAVAIGIDTDRSGGQPVPWPRGAGISSPGIDRFILAWGTGGEVSGAGGARTTLPAGAVRMDRGRNQMTIRVPRSVMDPGRATWRYVAGAGLWNGSGFVAVPAAVAPTAETPASGTTARPAPAIFNLAFRFDEPQARGQAIWFENGQSAALAAGTSGSFRADVDFARLAARRNGYVHAPGRKQARILPSRLRVPEGVRDTFPQFGGRLQPYLLYVPPGYRRGRPRPLTFGLHSAGANYTQWGSLSPKQPQQLGAERGSFYVTPLARGPDGWYTDEAEVDFFEVWSDVARRFSLNPRSVALSGYSMGGYGTFKLGTQWPDLFGRAFTTVGPPGRRAWVPPNPPTEGQSTNSNLVLENARWVPFLNWAGTADESVPYAGLRAQQARFDALGLRSQLWSFAVAHLTLAAIDEWAAARDFLARARVKRDPPRVDYAFMPDADRRALGLVHDHAYWVSRLRVRDRSGDPRTDPARGEVSARSRAFGVGAPVTRRVSLPLQGNPLPTAIEGTEWARLPRRRKANALALRLENVRSLRVDGRRARLRGDRCLKVSIASDGAVERPALAAVRARCPRGPRHPLWPGTAGRRRRGVPARRDPACRRRS